GQSPPKSPKCCSWSTSVQVTLKIRKPAFWHRLVSIRSPEFFILVCRAPLKFQVRRPSRPRGAIPGACRRRRPSSPQYVVPGETQIGFAKAEHRYFLPKHLIRYHVPVKSRRALLSKDSWPSILPALPVWFKSRYV
ncbi:hypothetical protein MTO96_037574, partial [Rhipicephalus appendiculatus]